MPLWGASYTDDLPLKTDIKAKFPLGGIHIVKTVICTSDYDWRKHFPLEIEI